MKKKTTTDMTGVMYSPKLIWQLEHLKIPMLTDHVQKGNIRLEEAVNPNDKNEKFSQYN